MIQNNENTNDKQEEILTTLNCKVKKFKDLLRSGQRQEAENEAREIFFKDDTEPYVKGWLACALFYSNFNSSYDLLYKFTEMHPDSLELARVYLAKILYDDGNFDSAANEARYYLRLVKDFEFPYLDDLSLNPYVQEGVSISLSIMRLTYQAFGALSYAKRLLQYALSLNLTDDWKSYFKDQLEILNKELKNKTAIKEDKKWESFFSSGHNANDLIDQCEKSSFPLMARRVSLIADNYRFNANFKIDLDEVFAIVSVTKSDDGKNNFILI